MSVLINMEMPTSCGECKAFVCYRQYAGDSGDCFCGITKSDAKAGARNDDCPLVPVPPHGDLIDRDATRESIKPWSPEDERNGCTFDTVKKLMYTMLDRAPTIIPAEEGET